MKGENMQVQKQNENTARALEVREEFEQFSWNFRIKIILATTKNFNTTGMVQI